ncbi:hypothetical protein H4582DRAFT_2061537 [Lactarius indigo]|nr:hypothetical protein H4582DRAFT_2061537 [Lactarius indigo]
MSNNDFNKGQVASGNAAPACCIIPFVSTNNVGASNTFMMHQRMMSGMGSTTQGDHDGWGHGHDGRLPPDDVQGIGRLNKGRMGVATVGGMNLMTAADSMGGRNVDIGGGVGGIRLWMGPIGMMETTLAGMGSMVAARGACSSRILYGYDSSSVGRV